MENVTMGSEGLQIEGGYFSRGYTHQPKSYSWEPKEDITAYELAQCMPILMAMSLGYQVEGAISDLPDNSKRHFREEWGMRNWQHSRQPGEEL